MLEIIGVVIDMPVIFTKFLEIASRHRCCSTSSHFGEANVRSHYRKFFHLSETHSDGWEHAYDSGRLKYSSFFCDRIDPGFSRGQDRKKEIFYSEKRSDG